MYYDSLKNYFLHVKIFFGILKFVLRIFNFQLFYRTLKIIFYVLNNNSSYTQLSFVFLLQKIFFSITMILMFCCLFQKDFFTCIGPFFFSFFRKILLPFVCFFLKLFLVFLKVFIYNIYIYIYIYTKDKKNLY